MSLRALHPSKVHCITIIDNATIFSDSQSIVHASYSKLAAKKAANSLRIDDMGSCTPDDRYRKETPRELVWGPLSKTCIPVQEEGNKPSDCAMQHKRPCLTML